MICCGKTEKEKIKRNKSYEKSVRD